MTPQQRAKDIWERTAWGAVGGASADESEARIAKAIEEAENEAVAAVLSNVVRLLRHVGKYDVAGRLVAALELDRQRVKQGHETEFPALRAAVPLPA